MNALVSTAEYAGAAVPAPQKFQNCNDDRDFRMSGPLQRKAWGARSFYLSHLLAVRMPDNAGEAKWIGSGL